MLKQIRQLVLCALLVTAIQSHQVLSQSQSGSSSAAATITPSTSTPSPSPSPTPSVTPIPTHMKPADPDGRRFLTPFSHPPKFEVRPAPEPTKLRPTPEGGEGKGVSGRNPGLREHRALRGVDGSDENAGDSDGDEDSSDSESERR
ncbi:unnamed protein product [Globisporangium polare]